MSLTTIEVVAALRQGKLLEPDTLREVEQTVLPTSNDVTTMCKELVRRGWLTSYQSAEVLAGRAAALVRGPYVLLDVIGKGGMGQVFKARHALMNRLVALKVIRSELLANEETVRRFRREIQAAAQLAHPNIVTAYHAEQMGDSHILAMEYCDGRDLGHVVKKGGPLPIGIACDYARQAALGLQHAADRGLVHRDIKPSNLMVSGGTVKILDFGLALLHKTSTVQGDGTLTEVGEVMGTPDFLAPEQALNPHKVDIRADLYSLGCTFYYLLAGRVLFPGGSAIEKVLRHQVEGAPALEQHRPDLPPTLREVLRRLLAKAPADRYQTPAEVVAALEPFARHDAQPAPSVTTGSGAPGQAGDTVQAPSFVPRAGSDASRSIPTAPDAFPTRSWQGSAAPAQAEPPPASATAIAPPHAPGRRRLVIGGVGAAVALAVIAFLVFGPGPRFWARSRGKLQDESSTDASSSSAVTGRMLPTPRQWERSVDLPASTRAASCLSFSPAGSYLAVGHFWMGEDEITSAGLVWDLDRQEEAGSLPRKGNVLAAAFTTDGAAIYWGLGYIGNPGDGAVFLWNIDKRKIRREWPKLEDGVGGLALNPDGKILATGNLKTINLWDTDDAKKLDYLEGHETWITCLAFSHDGKWLASGSFDKTVMLWDMTKMERAKVFPASAWISCLAFAPDDRTLVAATGDGDPQIMLWDLRSRELLYPPIAHGKENVHSIAFAPDGATFVTGCRDGKARVWELATAKQLDVLGHGEPVGAVAFSPDGQTLATGGGKATPVRLWKGR